MIFDQLWDQLPRWIRITLIAAGVSIFLTILTLLIILLAVAIIQVLGVYAALMAIVAIGVFIPAYLFLSSVMDD